VILRLLHLAVRCAVIAAPPMERARWREEWLAEVNEAARHRGARAALRFAAGALPDALALRRSASRPWRLRTGVSWLDVRLGLRMLVRYPGLTLVGGLGMAVAIAIGAISFTFIYSGLHPTLPLTEGDRIVGIENWDTSWNNQEERIVHDFAAWRRELTTVQDLAAFRLVPRNLIAPGRQVAQVQAAEITASGFRLARVAPVLGRPLADADERKGAPDVIVIGYRVWTDHFDRRASVVGETVRLGERVHTIVGVMPDGFAFPASERVWVPLRADPLDYERRRGPSIMVAARLVPGATRDMLQAELSAIGARMAAAHPKTHARLRPRAVRYTEMWFDDGPRSEMHLVQIAVSMLIVVVGINVAIVVYARTATRQAEILVRSALGATRRRIVAQLFVEALVLSVTAASAGLGIASVVLAQARVYAEQAEARLGGIPFWMTFSLSWGTVLYAGGLAVLAAAVVGVLPALNATGRRLQARLGRVSGGSGMQLGATWTTLIVLQVAFAVAVVPGAVHLSWESIRRAGSGPGFAAEQFLGARLLMERDVPRSADAEAYTRIFDARYRTAAAEIARRATREPEIAGVTHASTVPGDEPAGVIEIEGLALPPASPAGLSVKVLDVGLGFFDVFGISLVSGRTFGPRDLTAIHAAAAGPRAVAIVNRAFVRRYLADGNAVGRRLRHVRRTAGAAPPEPWLEIVGVVGNLPANPIALDETDARVYHPSRLVENGTTLLLHTRSAPAAGFATRLQQIAAAVDPTMRLTRVAALGDVYRQEQAGLHWGALGMALVTGSVMLLSAAGIYALMSFAVTRRRKEIGIRLALGADRGRILRAVFSRGALQLGAGVAIGVMASGWIDAAMDGQLMGGRAAIIVPLVCAIMVTVGLLAALGPARRGLRIDPTEALKADG
jgi:predicted permease